MADVSDRQAVPAFIVSAYEDSPIPMSVYDRDGFLVHFNAAHGAMWGLQMEQVVGRFNMCTEPQLAANGSVENHRRVMQGETRELQPTQFDPAKAGIPGVEARNVWAQAIYFPLRDEHGAVSHLCAMLRDVTIEIEQSAAIATAQAEIAAQRATIESLSSPVVQVWQGILTMPLVGMIDSRRAMSITASLLDAIARQQAHCVILDITGVPIVDTQVAQYLLQTAQSCRLLGCDVALVGVSVEIAQTIVQLGVDLGSLTTLADLQAGIAWAFKRLNLRVAPVAEAPARR